MKRMIGHFSNLVKRFSQQVKRSREQMIEPFKDYIFREKLICAFCASLAFKMTF